MISERNSAVLSFLYSVPYEETLLKLAGRKHSQGLYRKGSLMCELAQMLWKKKEKEILNLFESIYKIKITYFNQLFRKIQEVNLLGERGANLH